LVRTTIDLPDDLRARLLDLAARRGEKSVSGLVREAVASYLDDLDSRAAMRARAAGVLGTLSADEAAAMREAATGVRERWR
jgi:metal-responsive CopG/Arc/MetJ family transcriptional regulator